MLVYVRLMVICFGRGLGLSLGHRGGRGSGVVGVKKKKFGGMQD